LIYSERSKQSLKEEEDFFLKILNAFPSQEINILGIKIFLAAWHLRRAVRN
jgi:hypothetical protein